MNNNLPWDIIIAKFEGISLSIAATKLASGR